MASSGTHSSAKRYDPHGLVDPTNVVYVATNRVNGKCYVGLTTKGITSRKRSHASYAKSKVSDSYFAKAIRKHGIEAFDFSVLEVCRDMDHLKERERALIEVLRPEYNTAAGGISGPQGWRHSDETRQRMSDAKKGKPGSRLGKKLSLESIAKRTATRALSPVRPWLGKKRSAETIAKIVASRPFLPPPRPLTEVEKETRRVRCRKNSEKLSRPVRCATDGREFKHCVEAAEFYGAAVSALRRWCNKQAVCQRGLEFEYVEKFT